MSPNYLTPATRREMKDHIRDIKRTIVKVSELLEQMVTDPNMATTVKARSLIEGALHHCDATTRALAAHKPSKRDKR